MEGSDGILKPFWYSKYTRCLPVAWYPRIQPNANFAVTWKDFAIRERLASMTEELILSPLTNLPICYYGLGNRLAGVGR